MNTIENKQCPISQTACEGACVYAEILEKITLGIIGVDMDRQKIFYQNQQARDIFRGTIKPLDYGAISSLLLTRDSLPTVPQERGESKAVRLGTRMIGYTMYRVSERYYWVYVSDITEKERLNSIAEAINIMNNTGYIFSGIRHELGNPVNSVKMALQVLKKNLQKFGPEKIDEYLEQALSEVDRAEYMLKALKNFNMFERLHLDDVRMKPFMDKVLGMITRDFQDKGIHIRTLFKTGDETGYVDPRALQQIMVNLLTNASDALVRTDNPQISISVSDFDERVVIKVHDNGAGMAKRELKNLFKPFYTTKENGTGLGLIIVKNMLAKMKGTIEVESYEGSGTTVMLTLPRGRLQA